MAYAWNNQLYAQTKKRIGFPETASLQWVEALCEAERLAAFPPLKAAVDL